nr:LemA family protein [Halomonas sp. MCCC 1A11062]
MVGGIVTYNRIVRDFNRVEQGWAGVLVQERQILRTLPALFEQVSSYQQYERDIQERLTKMRTAFDRISNERIPSEADGAALQEAQRAGEEVVRELRLTVENYPELKFSEVVRSYMRELSKLEDNLAAALRLFNAQVAAFNSRIETFPSNLVNAISPCRSRIQVFFDSEASSSFEYRPNP